jgi:hypothetical protein
MWCKQCGQDVPGISSASGELCCARCGAVHRAARQRPAVNLEQTARHGLDLAAGPAGLEDWQLEQSVRDLQARVGISGASQSPEAAPIRRIDAAHRSLPRRKPPRRKKTSKPKSRGDVGSSLLAWSLMSVGLMLFACGGVLLGWSMVEDRPELWNIGLPIAAGGQVGLLLGLVLQLERVWQNSRYTVRKLDRVDSQLDHLERTTTMLGVTHGSASQAFYAHMADQSNPQILLADLKGQLDLLAMSMSRGK